MKKTLGFILIILLTLPCLFGQEKEVLALKEEIINLQNKGELGFQDFTLCSQIFGFAYYVPLQEPVIDQNGKFLLYYEPINIFTSKRGDLYEIWYTQDMAVLDAEGKIINEWKEILNFKYTSKKPVLDLFAQNSIDLKGMLPPGNYKFRAVLNDKLRNKSMTKTIDFEIK